MRLMYLTNDDSDYEKIFRSPYDNSFNFLFLHHNKEKQLVVRSIENLDQLGQMNQPCERL